MTRLFAAERRCLVSALVVLVLVSTAGAEQAPGAAKQFRAGAFAADITPDWFPIVVNGGFQPHYAKKAFDPLHARCLVLDDGQTRVAIVVVDSCVMDRPIHDEAKQLAEKRTGIPADRIFISTTHCHSAPAAVGALGTEPDLRYRRFLPGKIAEGIAAAQKNLAPAEVGWAVGSLPGVPQSRRWISRPDTVKEDPFGQKTTRATMHPGYRNPDWEEPSGPMNPDVPVIAVRRPGGRPIAVLSNFAIHYVGAPALSADYFGVFARRIGDLVGAGETCPPFVGMLSNGVSGDAYLNDYSRKEPDRFNVNSIAELVAQEAAAAYRKIRWHDWLPLAVVQSDLELAVRPPKLDWAKPIMREIEKEGRPFKSLSDFYAREQLLLAQMPPTRHLRLEVVRIGTLAMVGIPCEVFAITGLRINASSPFDYTFTVMLANGWDGYLPPPEQMAMGGYTTWLARSSCLEPQAEPKIRARVSKLLEQAAAGYRAEKPKAPPSAYAAAVLASKPAVYWRLDDFEGPHALDAVRGKGLGRFETQVAYYMPGPQPPAFPGMDADNRAPHFVGQRLAARVPGLGPSYTVEFWFYNCMPTDAREVTGYLFSRGPAAGSASAGEHLAIGGKGAAAGRLIFHAGADPREALAGATNVPLRNWVPRESWHHVAMVRDGSRVAVYLDGQAQPEIAGQAAVPPAADQVLIAGRNDGRFNFEGRIDEVAVYLRALPAEEVQKHYRAAVLRTGAPAPLTLGPRQRGE
jgi:hypothetical protein